MSLINSSRDLNEEQLKHVHQHVIDPDESVDEDELELKNSNDQILIGKINMAITQIKFKIRQSTQGKIDPDELQRKDKVWAQIEYEGYRRLLEIDMELFLLN